MLQGWQDDPGWATRVQRQLKAALPVLAEDIGLPWPLEEPLVVREAANRDANAVAGPLRPGDEHARARLLGEPGRHRATG